MDFCMYVCMNVCMYVYIRKIFKCIHILFLHINNQYNTHIIRQTYMYIPDIYN